MGNSLTVRKPTDVWVQENGLYFIQHVQDCKRKQNHNEYIYIYKTDKGTIIPFWCKCQLKNFT